MRERHTRAVSFNWRAGDHFKRRRATRECALQRHAELW
jgi:hypothetical protein